MKINFDIDDINVVKITLSALSEVKRHFEGGLPDDDSNLEYYNLIANLLKEFSMELEKSVMDGLQSNWNLIKEGYKNYCKLEFNEEIIEPVELDDFLKIGICCTDLECGMHLEVYINLFDCSWNYDYTLPDGTVKHYKEIEDMSTIADEFTVDGVYYGISFDGIISFFENEIRRDVEEINESFMMWEFDGGEING